MDETPAARTGRDTRVPAAPVLTAGPRHAVWVSLDGEVSQLGHGEAVALAQETPPILCHAKAVARRLGTAPFPALDVLELFAFARPAQFALPTPRGLAETLGLALPDGLEDDAHTLLAAAAHLLTDLDPADRQAVALAQATATAGWPWAVPVLNGMGADVVHARGRAAQTGYRVWMGLKEWSEHAPEPPPGHLPVTPEEARERLANLLPPEAEERTEQAAYAGAVAEAFAPTDREGEPSVVVAEAGTGVGKTLGYIAPASVWAEKNQGPVWISTYTRNLQRQLDGELDKLYPDPTVKTLKAVVRKGRENYLCLLNLEEAIGRLETRPQDAVPLAIVARWAAASRDGDMVGGDMPAWLVDLLGYGTTLALTDTRGECIYSACAHYGKCYIERTIRRARRADIVVANHALVMVQAALGGGDDPYLPTRYVFDEGHHLFDAADSAFCANISGGETAELRRWLIGAEGRRPSSRARGLKARIGELVEGDEKGATALADVLNAARFLPAEGWHQRIAGGNPVGAAEAFLARVRQQVYARDPDARSPYDLEAETRPPVAGMLEAAAELVGALNALSKPLRALLKALIEKLDRESDDLDTATRQRIEAACRALERRAILQAQSWRDMLESLHGDPPPEFVDWLSVARFDGRDVDVGMHRNWLDPTLPLAQQVIARSHGALITSATLRDGTGEPEIDWAAAETRVGADHLAVPPHLVAETSPFDYPALTRVFVVNDIDKNDIGQLAAAYRELMAAAGGGVIGLFTSIARLRGVHKRIVEDERLEDLNLLAQHVDPLDTGTLIDIFRAEENTCLLGTDAVRDGIDVPGRSLRMIVFDRVPWPRPTILHKARRRAHQNGRYDDMLTRLKLKQAFGRLVRRADDRGVFVLLDKAFPSRLAGAFPDGVEVQRMGLAEVIAKSRAFLAD